MAAFETVLRTLWPWLPPKEISTSSTGELESFLGKEPRSAASVHRNGIETAERGTDELEQESLDFAPIHSRVFATETKLHYSRHQQFYGYTGLTFAKWTCTLIIGLLTGLAAFTIEKVSEEVRLGKMAFTDKAIANGSLEMAFIIYLVYGVFAVAITSTVVVYYAPAAAGGGVTLVMANLNGVHIPYLLAARTLWVKILGTMAACTTGMAVGPEGPLAHVGAAIANNITALSAWGSLKNLSHPAHIKKDNIPSPSNIPQSPWGTQSEEQLDFYEEPIHSGRPVMDMGFLDNPVRQVQGSPGRKFVTKVNGEELSTKSSPTHPSSLVNEEVEDPFFVIDAKHMGLSEEAIATSHVVEEELVGKEEVANEKTLWQKIWSWAPTQIPVGFHADLDRRDFLSAGAAAGVGSAFGAPIGGVLFSLEEASSFWSRKVMWRSLICAALASLVLAYLRGGIHTGLLSFHSLNPQFKMQKLPFVIFTASSVGLLGAFFNRIHGWIIPLRASSTRPFLRVVESCLVVIVSIIFIFVLPFFLGECLPLPEDWASKNFGFQYTCERSENGVTKYNDLATLFFSIPDQTIRSLFEIAHGDPLKFTIPSLLVFSIAYLVMFELAYGAAMPGGLFMPSMMVGASFGALLGSFLDFLFPLWNIEIGHHALIGATAMLGGVFRGSISLVVIMVEGTGGIDFLLPITAAVVMANYAAHHFAQAGAYEEDLERLGNVAFLHTEPPHILAQLTAQDVMSPRVVGISKVVRVPDVLSILRNCQHNGFPVFSIHEHQTGSICLL